MNFFETYLLKICKRRQYIDHHGTGFIITTSNAGPGSSAAANRSSWTSLSLLLLGGLKVKNVVTDGQLEFDADGYVVTRPDCSRVATWFHENQFDQNMAMQKLQENNNSSSIRL
ncbi:Uncharacterized protein Rs2_36700 [Raphanus sativus]|nr:Uncharacterized protein Rs2_36700 [Raphanus sativus]